MMANKLGFSASNAAIQTLVNDLLVVMQEEALDYTNTFDGLAEQLESLIHPLHCLISYRLGWCGGSISTVQVPIRGTVLACLQRTNPGNPKKSFCGVRTGRLHHQ